MTSIQNNRRDRFDATSRGPLVDGGADGMILNKRNPDGGWTQFCIESESAEFWDISGGRGLTMAYRSQAQHSRAEPRAA